MSASFQQNSCRLCRKVFCCENCRLKHELNTHKIHPECDICIKGRIRIRNPSDSLLEHLQEKHWPLHCVCCERVFKTIDDIFYHNKCPKSLAKANDKDSENNSTPPILQKVVKLIAAGQSCVPTSTPLAPREDENIFLQQIGEVITPVEMYVEKNDELQYKSPFTPHNQRKNDQYTKRRVTFSETIEEITDNENLSPEKADEPSTPTSPYSNYCTAEMTLFSIDEADEKAQNDQNEDAVLQLSKRDSTTPEGETLWESAIDDVFENDVSIMEIRTTDETTGDITYWPTESDTNELPKSNKNASVWSSVTNIFKNVMQGFATTQKSANVSCASLKRRLSSADDESDDPEESRVLKKMKFTDIKCRRPIRYTQPALYVRYGILKKVSRADKVTQTD